MKIMIIHNRYLKLGGEDSVVNNEANALRGLGHEVIEFSTSNEKLKNLSLFKKFIVTIWNRKECRELENEINNHRPDIVHIHNTFHYLSLAVIHSVSKKRVPLFMTLHNYRLVCPMAMLFRDSHSCNDCLEKRNFFPALRYKCYRDSFLMTFNVVLMLRFHRFIKTFDKVDCYFVFNDFQRELMIQGGIRRDKLIVKPNSLNSVNFLENNPRNHSFGFIGRFDSFKGINELLREWNKLNRREQLVVIGGGELESDTLEISRTSQDISMIGEVSKEEVNRWLKQLRFLIFPSLLYEGMPMIILEAFSMGVPVIAYRIPEVEGTAVSKMVIEGVTGFTFTSFRDLDKVLTKAISLSDKEYFQLSQSTFNFYKNNFTVNKVMRKQLSYYQRVLEKYQAKR